jgi:hypothetical protein
MRQLIPWPAAPGNAATILLFTTHEGIAVATLQPVEGQYLHGLAANRVNAWEAVWLRNNQASAANGIRLYALDDQGVMREVDCKDDSGNATIGSGSAQAVGALSTGQERRLLIDTSRYHGFAVTYTAGATGPTNWNGVQQVHLDVEAVIK